MKSQIQRAQKYLTREKPRPDKAIGILKKFLKRKDTPWPVYHLMGVALLQKGKYTASADYLEKAINKGSDEPETYHLLGVNFFNLGKFDEAEQFEKEALERREDFFEAWLNLGEIYRRQARLDEALECYQKANQLDPRSAAVAYRIGAIYRDQGDLTKALELFDVTLKIKPDYVDALMEKAEIFKKKQQFDKAEECLNSALEKRKGNPAIRVMVAELNKERGNYEEAISIYENILSEYPKEAGIRSNYALCLQELGRFDESEKNYLKALEDKTNSNEALSNYLMGLHYNPKRTKQKIFKAHFRWNELFAPEKRNKRPIPQNKDEYKQLRIGFLSGGFRRHPVGWMITRALEHLPKDQFEIYCYTTNNAFDTITRRIHGSCDVWRSVVGYNDEITAKMIRDDEIDILVELSGHAADNRLKTVDLEPAPVIVKWVGGLFNTTGLRSVDYLLTDWYETPAGEEEFYTEKLVRLPNDYISFLPPEYAPPVSPMPANENGYITFGCFNNPTKINEDLLEQWANIMKRVPGSRLFLKSRQYDTPALTDRIIKQMASHGIDEERLTFEGYSLHEKLLGTYSQVDIALDPWPYSGGLTTCEALWMGVPVVTKPGPTFAGRHSTTHLTNAGFPEWVTETWEEYVNTTVSLAENTEKLAEIRAGLRDTLAKSPVCNGKRFAAHLSVAFREMWKQRVEGYKKNLPEGEWQDHIEVKALSAYETEGKIAISKAETNKPGTKDGGTVFDSSFLDEGDQQETANVRQANDSVYETPLVNGVHKNGAHKASNGHIQSIEAGEKTETFKIGTKDEVTICTPGNLDLLTPYVLLEQEEWFEPELNFVRGYLKPGMNILDIGAGFGAYALPMAKLTGEEGTVYAFEPGSVARMHLEMSKLENRLDNLEIIGRAVADQTGKAKFHLAETPELNRLDEQGDEEVSQTTLDAWWEFEGRPEIDFIKLDVNGSEAKVLSGAEELLTKTSPVIQFAIREGGQQLSETSEWLNGKGYHVYEYVPGPQLLTPHDSRGGADPYLMNLIAIKGDRIKTFKKSGWLHDEAFEPDEPEAGRWKQTLRQLPWAQNNISEWEQQALSPQNREYLQALNYLCVAEEIDLKNIQSPTVRSEKAVLMLGAAQIFIQLYNGGHTSLPIALTLARVLIALGKRGQAVDILKKVMESNKIGQQGLEMDLPFLLPLPEQDETSIHTDFAKWLMVRVTEAWILLKDVTTYLSGERERKLLETLEGNPEVLDTIEKRNVLILKGEGSNNSNLHSSSTSTNKASLLDGSKGLKHLHLVIPGRKGGAHGIHEIHAQKLAERVRKKGIATSIVYASSKEFIEKIIFASKRPGHVFYAGVMGYDLLVHADMNIAGNVFDLYNVPVIGFLGDHPYTQFMWNRMERCAKNTIFVTPTISVKQEFEKIYGSKNLIKALKYVPPPSVKTQWENSDKRLKDRSIDILIPWGLHKFLANQKSLNKQLEKLGKTAKEIGKIVYQKGKTEYEKTLFEIFLQVTKSKLGKEYQFNTSKTEEDRKWLKVLSLIDWAIRKDRRLDMLKTLVEVPNEYNVVITAHSQVASFVPGLQQQNNINWIGEVSAQKLDELYANSKTVLNCNPTYPDTIHGRVRNGMANGCYIMSDFNPVLARLFGDNIGFVNSNCSLKSLLPKNWDELQEKADNGRKIIQAKFTEENMARRIIEIAQESIAYVGQGVKYGI